MNYLSNFYKIITNKFYFKILYLLISLSTITLLRFIPGIRAINKILIFWGIFLIFINILDMLIKRYLPSKFQIAMYTFLLITFLFTLIKYPSMENLKLVIINAMILTLFFDVDVNKSKNKLIQELKVFSYIYCIFTFILSFISLIIYFSKETIWISETLNGEYLVYSFTTAFANENSLGISAVISLIISIYLLISIKSKPANNFLMLFNIMIQSIAMIISNSRSVYLIIATFILFSLFMYLKNYMLRITLIILPFLSVIFLFITNKASINNFLTGRDILWSTCFDVIKNNPIFGIGFTNLTNVLSEEKVLTLGRVHNIYIELAATNGLITLIVFIVILALIILFIFKKIDSLHYKQFLSYNVLFALIISIMSVNLVESSLVYIISFISIVFWVISSYLVSILLKK